jgi:transposase-like protein
MVKKINHETSSSQNKPEQVPTNRERKYTRVTDEQREELVRKIVKDQRTVIDVASEMGLDYENAKLIYRIYKREGRTKQIPMKIKCFASILQTNPEALRAKISDHAFDRIQSQWDDFQILQNKGLNVASRLNTKAETIKLPPISAQMLNGRAFDHRIQSQSDDVPATQSIANSSRLWADAEAINITLPSIPPQLAACPDMKLSRRSETISDERNESTNDFKPKFCTIAPIIGQKHSQEKITTRPGEM